MLIVRIVVLVGLVVTSVMANAKSVKVSSPDGSVMVSVGVKNHCPYYTVSYQGRTIEIDGKSYVFRQINPMIWANMQGIEQRDNIAIATPERAFLDMMYLSSGQCYFDNLHPLNKKKVQQLLALYNSPTLTKRVEALLNGSK